MTADNEPRTPATQRQQATDPGGDRRHRQDIAHDEAEARTLFGALDDVERSHHARTQGTRAAKLSAATGWRLAAEQPLDEPIASGQASTAEDVYPRVGQPLSGHRNTTGGLILRSARTGPIVPTDAARAKRSAARARLPRAWQEAK